MADLTKERVLAQLKYKSEGGGSAGSNGFYRQLDRKVRLAAEIAELESRRDDLRTELKSTTLSMPSTNKRNNRGRPSKRDRQRQQD